MPTDASIGAILLARAAEKLRQEQEIFGQRKRHDARWFYLRLAMGYCSIALLAAVIVVASIILLGATQYPQAVYTSAGAALFADVIALLVSVWKVVLSSSVITPLDPVTEISLPTIGSLFTGGEIEVTAENKDVIAVTEAIDVVIGADKE
jgi:hypothetical protein